MSLRKASLIGLLIVAVILLVFSLPAPRPAEAQQPTGSVPTVTGTPVGATVSVDPSLEQIDVYSGPSTYLYPAIGILLTGESAPAIGRSRNDNNWIEIRYQGVPGSVAWVYGPYVSLLRGGDLPLVDSPPTPTPISTPTINPTLVAAFIPAGTATRLATFTPPAQLSIPTFVDQSGRPSGIPVGLLIFGLAFVGVIGAIISFLRGR